MVIQLHACDALILIAIIEPQIPNHVESPNFSRVFGTNTSAFELLVLKRKIMGPCWLQIKNPTVDHKGVSVYIRLICASF